MAKVEFCETISCGPAVLYRADLIALADLFSEGGSFSRVDSYYSFTVGSTKKTADTISDLLADTLSHYTNKFSAGIFYYSNETNIVATLLLTCYHNYITFQISSNDSTWFHGKREQLRAFFKDRRPWYASLKPIMPLAWILLLNVFAVMTVLAARRNNWLGCAVMTTACLLFVVIAIQEFRQRLFPFVRIFFRDRKSIEWTPELTISALGLVVAVVAIVIEIIKN
jgi:hypothetical protein